MSEPRQAESTSSVTGVQAISITKLDDCLASPTQGIRMFHPGKKVSTNPSGRWVRVGNRVLKRQGKGSHLAGGDLDRHVVILVTGLLASVLGSTTRATTGVEDADDRGVVVGLHLGGGSVGSRGAEEGDGA